MMKLIILYLTLVPVLIIHSELKSDHLDSLKKCLNKVVTKSIGSNTRSTPQSFRTDMKVQKQEWQIVNGTVADISEFPYTSFVFFCNAKINYSANCGGSIITDYHILTAAHCAIRWNPITTILELFHPTYEVLERENFLIEVGASFIGQGGQYKTVSEVHVHPEYNSQGNKGRDLSVLKVAEKFSMSNKVATIPVATPELSDQLQVMEKSNTECIIAGWGDTLQPEDQPYRLRFVKLPLMPIEVCIQLGKLALFYITREDHICTYRRYKDACQGDSGGGLLCKGEDGVQRVWGVVSFGYGCGDKLKPGYYARVDNAYSFLKQFFVTKSSRSAATLERALLKLLFLVVLQFASSI